MFSTQLLLATVPGVAAAPPASVTATANESFVPFGNFGWLWIQAQQIKVARECKKRMFRSFPKKKRFVTKTKKNGKYQRTPRKIILILTMA